MDRLTAIQVFLNVVETGSFTATATRLHLSRSMVSRYIAVIEDWLDARLLHRTTRAVTLTEAGEQAVRFCRQIANLSEQLEEELLVEEGALRGSLRLASNISFGATHLTTAISRFQQLHPQLKIQLTLSDEVVNLVEERIDLAIRISQQPDPNLFARPLADCHSVLVATPRYLAQHALPRHPTDLTAHRCLAHAHFNKMHWQFHQGDQRLELNLNNVLSSNDALSLLHATLADAGIAMLPAYLVADYVAKGELQVVLAEWQCVKLKIYALYSSRRKQPKATRLFLDFLVAEFADKMW